MDKSIVVEEENHKRNESLALTPKGSASLVQINSIAIDINCAVEEIESPKHEHFSIRAFVSEVRKKDRKTCYPFASEDKKDNGIMDLPPLSIPKFRWWQCPNCVSESADQKSPIGIVLADKIDIAGASCCQNRSAGEKEGLHINSVQNIGDEETNYQGDEIIAYNPRFADVYKVSASVRTTEVGTSRNQVTEANLVQMMDTSVESSDKECSAGPSSKPYEPEKESSGSDDAIVYSALPHKRKPKLRSLADIINEEQNFVIEHPRTKSISSSQTEDDSNSQVEIEVSSDAAKSTKTTLRKRKYIVHEDDGGQPETSPPNFMAKKLKSSTLEAENISIARRRVEISGSDSEREGPTRPDVRITAKALPSKARKQKAPEINRKTRRGNVEKRTAVQMMCNSSAHYANLGGSLGNMGNAGLLLKKSVFGQEMDGFSDLSKGKRPQGSDYDAYVSLRESGSGDCAVRGKVALDLSLRSYKGAEMNSKAQESSGKYTNIPDLNELFVDKTNVMEGQMAPDFPETRTFALHENLDILGSSSREPAREGKRPSGILEQHQAAHNMYYNNRVVEHGTSSDDIPMEIVELLAKNQHDRALDNSRKHLGPDGINNSLKRAHYGKNTRGPVNFPYGNPRTGLSVASGNIGLGQGFLNFSQTNNCHPDKTQFRHLSPLTAGPQRIPLYPGPPNHMCGPRPREGADLLWAPRRKNVTFDLTDTQSRPVQSNGLDDQSYRDKTVINMRGDDGKIGSGRTHVGSMDAYSNETIPAMQLLSLMDQGIVSGSSFKVGPNNFLDRPYSSCNHHLRLNKNDNQSETIVGSSLLGKSNHINDFPALLNGARFSGESSKRSFSQVRMPPLKGNSKAVDLVGPSNLVGQPSRSDLRLEVCTLNRNPADFSIPNAKNEYMIGPKDLKPKKRNSSKDRARPTKAEGPKRQKGKKDSSI